jgi:hypothetical protein
VDEPTTNAAAEALRKMATLSTATRAQLDRIESGVIIVPRRKRPA